MRTVDIDIRPTDSAHQVYQTKVSPAKHPRTVGLGQLRHEERLGHIEQPESTSLSVKVERSKYIAVRIAVFQRWMKQGTIMVHTYISRNQLSEMFCTKQTVSAIRKQSQA